MKSERESMSFDVVIVGAGPAGLSAAIRLAQLNSQRAEPLSICILEKGSQVGAHILSGNVFDPIALNTLIPDWPTRNAPIHTRVTSDAFYLLTTARAIRLPVLKPLRNHGNFIISLGRLCQWLAEEATALGVNIFPGFAGAELLYNENDAVIGVRTGDAGRHADGTPSERFQPGIDLFAKQTVLAEGCRGSLSESVIQKYALRAGKDPQTYAIGFKEIWKIQSVHHAKGKVVHTAGWPLASDTYGGGFIYHDDHDRLLLGFVVGLDYRNPHLDPFKTFQQFKTHPYVRALIDKGECVRYGARALNEGGLQAIPQLAFPGGLLVGCSAGFLNVPRIKGTHTAMQSGILAAEALHQMPLTPGATCTVFDVSFKKSWVYAELHAARNVRAGFRKGLWCGLAYAAIDQGMLRGKAPWTFHYTPDHDALKPANRMPAYTYPKPDGSLTFERLSQVFLTNLQYREGQPCHLKLKDASVPIRVNLPRFDAPEQRYCPAGVYEIIYPESNMPQLQINAANCIHCKTCDIKDPLQNIVWTPPEGGDGPNYQDM